MRRHPHTYWLAVAVLCGAIAYAADGTAPPPPRADARGEYTRLQHIRSRENIRVPGKDIAEYRKAWNAHLQKRYPLLETRFIGYIHLVDALALKTDRREGFIRRFAYDKTMDLYNHYVAIIEHLDSLNLPGSFCKALKFFYASEIIIGGREFAHGVGKTRNALSDLPAGGRSVAVSRDRQDLYFVIVQRFPWFRGIDPGDQGVLLKTIADMNPHVRRGPGQARNGTGSLAAARSQLESGGTTGNRGLQGRYHVHAKRDTHILVPEERKMRRIGGVSKSFERQTRRRR